MCHRSGASVLGQGRLGIHSWKDSMEIKNVFRSCLAKIAHQQEPWDFLGCTSHLSWFVPSSHWNLELVRFVSIKNHGVVALHQSKMPPTVAPRSILATACR